MTEETNTSTALEAMIRGTLDINDSRSPDENDADDESVAHSDEQAQTNEDEKALEWHEVIELQAFSERKAWIEEKTAFLEKLPPIEVFAGLDAVRSSAVEVPGLPTRAQLQEWLVEHDKIEKETEIFDSGELRKLKKFTKAAAQRNLSPADTDLIELTLTTIYELDKLLHLLRDRSDNLDLLSIRLTWEERRAAAWTELHSLISDMRTFLSTRARWSPTVYDAATEDEATREPGPKRRNSVVSIASMTSDTSISSSPGFSRSTRFKLAESLSRDAAQFASRVSSLKHTKIAGAGKALDKLIDRSRRPVPDELLDEQDKLEDEGINEMEDVGKFVMNVVMQWKKADEIYVETAKDKTAAQTLQEDMELARMSHPTSRQDAAFLSRTNALIKRLTMRDNPASSASLFIHPTHPLFPDQRASNESITRLLSSEIATALDYARKAESFAKEYHATFEAVKRVEAVCKTASDLSTQFDSLIEHLRRGIATENGDGTPPDLSTEACLESTRHSVFLSSLPSILQQLQQVDTSSAELLPSARIALLNLDRPGVDAQFKVDSGGEIERLETCRNAAARLRMEVTSQTSTLHLVRQIWSSMDQIFRETEGVRGEVSDATERYMWRQQIRSHEAPPTPESPVTPLPPLTISPASVFARLDSLQARHDEQVCGPLSGIVSSIGPALQIYLTRCSTGLSSILAHARKAAVIWESVQSQTTAMESVRDEAHGLQVEIEDLRIRFDKVIQDVLSSELAGDELLLTEGGLTSDLKRSQDSVRAFIDGLSHRVPFVNEAGSALPSRKRKPTIGGFNLVTVEQAATLEVPINLDMLDRTVRADSNAYSMMLSGAMKALEHKAAHFQLAKTAQAVDTAVASVLNNIRRVVHAVTSMQNSLDDMDDCSASKKLELLSDEVDRLVQNEGLEISRSLSPIRGLLHRMKTNPEGCELGVLEGTLTLRERALDDTEGQYNAWKAGVAALQQRIIQAQQSECARVAEERRIQEERDRLEAEQRDRIANEQAEAECRAQAEQPQLEAAEREARRKIECDRLEAEERDKLDRDRLESERKRQAKELENSSQEGPDRLQRPAAERTTSALHHVLEPLAESEAEMSLVYGDGPQSEDDVFGLQLLPAPTLKVVEHEADALHEQVLALRKRLRSLHINELARPVDHSSHSLPTHAERKRLARDFSAVAAEADSLPSSSTDPSLNTELRSLRSEVEASAELMQRVHSLADLSDLLLDCDNTLSDLLEHIDSYPSPPLGTLSTAYTSEATSKPENQMSARLTFTKGVIEKMDSLYSSVAEDHRAVAEHDRIMQTWSELEAMGLDRITGAKSRPGSVMSSGRSSRASTVSAQAAAIKKATKYPNLSAGSSRGRFLAPPLNARRTTSGSSAGQHTRSSSRASITSSNRSVSGPGLTSSSASTLHGSTFSSRQRTTSVSSTTSIKTPLKQTYLTPSRPRAQTNSLTSQTPRTASPAFSDASSLSISRSGLNLSQSSVSRPSWSRAPRQSFPSVIRSPPRSRVTPIVKKPYVANPKNKLDVAVGDVVNRLPVNINVEVVADTWKDQSGKYWIGDQDPKLCFCRILRSQTVMVRVGGGWSELSKFIKDHFADAFRILPDSPRLGSREEKWISSSTLSQAAEAMALPNPPKTPEPRDSPIPSFALSTPSGRSPKSIKSTSSPGSPLTPLQFLRRADRESPVPRAESPTKSSRPGISAVLKSPARQPVWRP